MNKTAIIDQIAEVLGDPNQDTAAVNRTAC